MMAGGSWWSSARPVWLFPERSGLPIGQSAHVLFHHGPVGCQGLPSFPPLPPPRPSQALDSRLPHPTSHLTSQISQAARIAHTTLYLVDFSTMDAHGVTESGVWQPLRTTGTTYSTCTTHSILPGDSDHQWMAYRTRIGLVSAAEQGVVLLWLAPPPQKKKISPKKATVWKNVVLPRSPVVLSPHHWPQDPSSNSEPSTLLAVGLSTMVVELANGTEIAKVYESR